MCAPVRNDKEKSICFDVCLAWSTVLDDLPRSARASGCERARAEIGQRNPSDLISGSFYPVSFLPSTRKILGPAQRSHLLRKREIQRKKHVFSFSHSFFFLQKKEWEKKEKRLPRSLRFVSQRRLRRNQRRLASQRRLLGRNPAAGG